MVSYGQRKTPILAAEASPVRKVFGIRLRKCKKGVAGAEAFLVQ